MISEVEMSLEEQLAAIQKQLLALSQLPAAIQQTLDVVTQQLTKIVGPVNDPNAEVVSLAHCQRTKHKHGHNNTIHTITIIYIEIKQ